MNSNDINEQFVFRWGTVSDLENAATTMQDAFDGEEEMGNWVRMMMDGHHASARPDTVALAEEKSTGRVAAVITTCPQTWYYEGIPFKALNVTEVGTHPEFQGRDLVTHLMSMIHERLMEDEYDFSMVWGIPWFYKKFGYYQTLGNKVTWSYARYSIVQKFGDVSPYLIRPFEVSDIDFAITLHLHAAKESLISFPYDEKYWKMFVFDYFEENRDQYRVIEKNGTKIGLFAHNSYLSNKMSIYMFNLVEGESWFDVLPWVTAYLLNYGDEKLKGEGRHVEEVQYSLQEGHPVFEIMRECYGRKREAEQNYYRIVDMCSFLKKISPILEQRLAISFMCGYSRKVQFQLFGMKKYLLIHFDNGAIVDISWQENLRYYFQDLHLPLEYFMHILFGQKDIDDYLFYYREVGSWNDEVGVNNEMRMLFKILFPKKPSSINHCL